MTQPQVGVFDIGNLLIEWQPERIYDRRIGKAGRRVLFAEVDLQGRAARIDAGARFPEAACETVGDRPKWAEETRWRGDHGIERASPRIDRSTRLKRALRGCGLPPEAA